MPNNGQPPEAIQDPQDPKARQQDFGTKSLRQTRFDQIPSRNQPHHGRNTKITSTSVAAYTLILGLEAEPSEQEPRTGQFVSQVVEHLSALQARFGVVRPGEHDRVRLVDGAMQLHQVRVDAAAVGLELGLANADP